MKANPPHGGFSFWKFVFVKEKRKFVFVKEKTNGRVHRKFLLPFFL